MIIAVASGKGGTGKTTVAASLASTLSANNKSAYLDCDVEAPNGHLFLNPKLDHSEDVNVLIPQVDEALCTGCGRCAEVCEFHAIITFGQAPLVFPELCHGCGSCTLVCPEKALTEVPNKIGIVETGGVGQQMDFARGLLNIGQPMAVPIIHQLKKHMDGFSGETFVLDSPPGASCPVVESIRDSDFVILVTEPTPFGLHDLRQAVELARELDIPAGVIINRDGIGDAGVEAYCQEAGVPILMRIPYDQRIGEGVARGQLLVDILPEFQDKFQALYKDIRGLVNGKGGGR
jgi:MinD superfamily P-loop ATPase